MGSSVQREKAELAIIQANIEAVYAAEERLNHAEVVHLEKHLSEGLAAVPGGSNPTAADLVGMERPSGSDAVEVTHSIGEVAQSGRCRRRGGEKMPYSLSLSLTSREGEAAGGGQEHDHVEVRPRLHVGQVEDQNRRHREGEHPLHQSDLTCLML